MNSVLTLVLAAAPLPVLIAAHRLLRANRRRQTRLQLARAYDRNIRMHKLSIEAIDILEDKAIGLDRKNRKVLLVAIAPETKLERCIPLQEVTACNVKQTRNQNTSRVVAVTLDISCIGSNSSVQFNFYEAGKNRPAQLPHLLAKAEYWKRCLEPAQYRGRHNYELEYVL